MKTYPLSYLCALLFSVVFDNTNFTANFLEVAYYENAVMLNNHWKKVVSYDFQLQANRQNELFTPLQYDVVIDEIMSDPAPQVGLPNNEWVELKNTSSAAVNLLGWKVGDSNGQSAPMPDFILLPDSFVIVCAGSAAVNLSAFGSTISVSSFPSLDNAADQLFLKSPQNSIIHSVSYQDSWYQNELKREGGWTLEMIDTKNPCNGSGNWKAGTDIKGGTPGMKNSRDGSNADNAAPGLLRGYTTDSKTIILVFDEPLDSFKTAVPGNYFISDGIGKPVGVSVISPAFNKVSLQLSTALSGKMVYTVKVTGLTDCVGNVIGHNNTASIGLSEVAALSDIVINEILFNPSPGGNDFVEIYNRSKKIIDLKQTYIANRNSGGTISGIAELSAENYLLFPNEFMVITENAANIKAKYITQNRDAFLEIDKLPTFNDDRGTVIILNPQGEVTDELSYHEKWHFNLIDNREGVALERIDYNAPTQSQDNWHSAASSLGYATPTYKNSQFRINDGVQGMVKSLPEVFSPDNDGQDDFVTVEYNFPEPGYVANITIFDGSGRLVRNLQRNALCGTKGNYRWDGLGEKSQQLAIGVYVIFMEVFNLKGIRKQFKHTVVLARRSPF